MAYRSLVRWKIMQQIEKSVQKQDGTIFGGYCRDKIIHDHYACLFYEKSEHTCRTKYGDPSYHPESAQRLHIPVDIDCFMHSSKLAEFKSCLAKKKFHVHEKSTTTAQLYFPGVPGSIMHTKLSISFDVNYVLSRLININELSVLVDVLHSADPTMVPPFGCVDFDCNSVLLTPDNEYKICKQLDLSAHPKMKLEKLNATIETILKKQTFIINDNVPKYRILSMLNKGWTVSSKNISVMKKKKESVGDNVCFVCLDGFSGKFVARFSCCSASCMHVTCASELLQKCQCESCPMCRKTVDPSNDDKQLVKIGEFATTCPIIV